jgi:hypothetical protein
MFKAMALKELRETRGVVLLGLGGWLLLSWMQGARESTAIPFVDDGTAGYICFISVLMAIGLGLRQTLGESVHGTYPFLFHRPATRCWLIGMKLLVGMAVYMIAAAVPILIYGLWAATPGSHASPFYWWMTAQTWVTCFCVTAIYLTAFLTGLRPGRWYRSRLLPLAGGLVVFCFVLFGITSTLISIEWGIVLAAAADLWLIGVILFAARTRDYP